MSELKAAGGQATISYEEAAGRVASYSGQLRAAGAAESVELLESLGRVLAAPVIADRSQPPFARSTRDGFACSAAGLDSGVRVIGTLRAGEMWTGAPLARDEAVEIMTGAPLPPGADCVVMVEHAIVSDSAAGSLSGAGVETRMQLGEGRSICAGDNYIPAGAEALAGATLVAEGTRMGPAQVGAAASVGAARVKVYMRPRVAILATGDELVGLEAEPEIFQIRNSNSYSLAAQVRALGAEAEICPTVADTKDALLAALGRVRQGFDLVLLSGGVSMGKYDLVEGALASLGAQFFFSGVRMQPGKPVVFGAFAGGPVFFGLPGNPVSTMVTFLLFAAPVLAALGGERGYSARFAEARLTRPVEQKPRLRRFLPGRLEADVDRSAVTPVPWQGSGDLAGTAAANSLIVVPEAEPGSAGLLAEGARVRVLLL